MHITLILQVKYKMSSISEVLMLNYAKLTRTLPLKDPIFVAELYAHGLLPGDLMDQIQRTDRTEAANSICFLNSKIKRDVEIKCFESFNILLAVMESCEYKGTKNLAEKIKIALMEVGEKDDDVNYEKIKQG